MNLDSARSAKKEIRARVNAEILARGIEELPQLAFGVARGPSDTDFKVAVRARSADDLPPDIEETIQELVNGELDLRYTGPIEAKPAAGGSAVARKLMIGASVAHHRCTAGTLGFFARRISDGLPGIVSNNHVLALEDKGRDGDAILHPAPADSGRRIEDAVAFLDGRYPKLRRQRVVVDCAFAPLAPGLSFDPRPLGKKRLLAPQTIGPDVERDVCKVGRTTGATVGRITAFEFEPFYIDYNFGSIRVENQIEIESSSQEPFSAPGDSGSLVFAASSHLPIGLLFASSSAGGKFDSGLAYANPIDSVLEALGVTLIT